MPGQVPSIPKWIRNRTAELQRLRARAVARRGPRSWPREQVAIAVHEIGIAGDRIHLERRPALRCTPVARSPTRLDLDDRIAQHASCRRAARNASTMPPTSVLVPPLANQTPPSFSSLWISA